MPRRSELCYYCVKVDFEKALRSKQFFSTSLGTWEGTQQRTQCPWCRLLVRCIRMGPGEPEPSDTLKLTNKESWKCCVANSEYDGEERADQYNNEYDLKSGNKSFSGRYNKRLIVKWSRYAASREVQYVVDPELLADEGLEPYLFLGRRVPPHVDDFALFGTWLDHCEDYHGSSCAVQSNGSSSSSHLQVPNGHQRSHSQPGISRSSSPSGTARTLRFIDVEKLRIVRRPSSSTYAIMSYVWGESQMRRAMPKTMYRDRQVEERLGYIPLPKYIPRTIHDCIEVARSLGYQYLWNDALCIVQDDDREQQVHIDRMDAIYHNADLTIVAGSGTHADHGLPGISAPRRYKQYSERIAGFDLAPVLPTYNRINDTSGTVPILHTNSRGWTLQEKLLSRRILLFTDHQIYFRCRNVSWAEDTIMETRALSKSVRRRASPFAWVADRQIKRAEAPTSGFSLLDWVLKPRDSRRDLGLFPNYIAVVEAYTPRKLTYPGDRLRAISGILRTLEPGLGQFHAGLPTEGFLRALLWAPLPGSVLVRPSLASPSWSWAGWECQTGWCHWSSQNLEDIDEYPRYQAFPQEPRAQLLHLPKQLRREGCIIEVVTRTTRHRLCPASSNASTRSLLEPRLFRRHRTLLRMQTAIVTFSLRMGSGDAAPSQHELLDIVDRKGRCVGELMAPALMSQQRHGHDREFLLLSWSRGLQHADKIDYSYIPTEIRPPAIASKRSDGTPAPPSSPVPVKQSDSEWTVANVMLIGWDRDQDIAQRVGIGKIIWTALADVDIQTEVVYVG